MLDKGIIIPVDEAVDWVNKLQIENRWVSTVIVRRKLFKKNNYKMFTITTLEE